MENIITLKNTQDYNIHLKKLKKPNNEDSKLYLLESDILYFNTGIKKNGAKYIELFKGRELVEKEEVPEVNLKIDYIEYVVGYGYIIKFK